MEQPNTFDEKGSLSAVYRVASTNYDAIAESPVAPVFDIAVKPDAGRIQLLPLRDDTLQAWLGNNQGWLQQTVHVPSFRRQYAEFWGTDVSELDLVFTSLVFIIISISALYIPFQAVEIVGCPREAIRDLAHIWYSSSRSALAAGESEARPCLVQLQVFSVTQLYWYAINDIETLNSCLGRAVRTAQALNIDKDRLHSTCLQDEMRHRLWWDIANADTFQSICLDRPPLIRLQLPGVPLPLNCADNDLTETSVNPRPLDEPTEVSMSIFRSQFSRTINRHICSAENEENKSYEVIQRLDADILDLMDKLPWYFRLGKDDQLPRIREPLCEVITWQHHILRTFIGTQRIRMHHPFILSHEDCWKNCAGAAENTLAVYRALRRGRAVTSQQKFFPQAYQIFSVAVSLTTLLMLEELFPTPNIYQEIKDIAGDLKALENQGCAVPIATFGRQVLLKLFELYEKGAVTNMNSPSREAESLASDISSILNGSQPSGMCVERQAYHNEDSLMNAMPNAQIPYHGIGITASKEGMTLRDTDFTTRSLLDIAWGAMPSEFDWSLFLEDLNNSEMLRNYPSSKYPEMG
ncbi:transcription factor [Trichoderma arundinaceum]|uniref:Transcription factor n=1 Tax=Trichoderma arundinaceum TaxID=490622 RepID=A0A395NFF2_TRIAR|nr:transcription factor [Trichoderma arundinaceum]